MNFADAFYGSCTIGERGQLVIPAEARVELGISPGDKVIVMRHPIHQGLMILKIEALREFLDDFSNSLSRLEERQREEDEK